MAILDINIYGDEVLRVKAKPVEKVTPELVQLAHDMLETMYEAPGIGLAAPQIGKSIRLIVCDVTREEDDARDPHIFFNPEISAEDGENPLLPYEEGCLSVPEIYAEVMRPGRIRVKALDINGNAIELRNVDGLLARCIQHEVDHLEGVLFVDKISAADRALNQSKLKKMSKSRKV